MQHSRVKSKLSVCFFLFLFPLLSIVLSDESFAQDAQEPSKEKAEKKTRHLINIMLPMQLLIENFIRLRRVSLNPF